LEGELSSFNARLRLPGRTRLPLGVEVDILHERMTLTAGDRTVADWPLERLDVTVLADGFHITVDDEEMVLSVTDTARFAAELGVENRPSRSAVADHPKRNGLSSRITVASEPDSAQLEELRDRISEIARNLASDSVPPEAVFAEWLRVLKEINRRHGEGSLPNPLYYQLNTHLLELIPEPAFPPV
jgi:hypothetical protein